MRSSLESRWRALELLIALLYFVLSTGSGAAACAPETHKPPDAILAAIGDRLQQKGTEIKTELLAPEDARAIVRDRLNKTVGESATAASGIDYHFVLRDTEHEAQIGVLTLDYRDEEAAKVALSRLGATTQGYFKYTKILTRYSATIAGSHLIVVFTESSGSDAVSSFVDTSPDELAH